ncbi:cytochrome P450 [Pseudophaeobacter arcticus]|uniref:cytochrome P450 n=1 Tax=Pseudophaeobacter arcticus TaxID=385492 RepID=UPI000487DB04|nr:cytochrome P450 [Pseudophaeobacter arcticus]
METDIKSAFHTAGEIIGDPQMVSEILRSTDFQVPQIEAHIIALQEQSGISFANILQLTRSTAVFQKNPAHLATRRAIAPFFTAKAVKIWTPTIDAAVEKAIGHLLTVKDPDLVTDFCDPLFITVFGQIIGLKMANLNRLSAVIKSIGRLSQPMLSIKVLKQIEAEIQEIDTYLPKAPSLRSATLLSFLQTAQLNENPVLDPRDTSIWLLVAGYTASQTLGFILSDLLQREKGVWMELAKKGLPAEVLEDLIARLPSTRTLVRTANASVQVSGCPFHQGDIAVMDVIKANEQLRTTSANGNAHLSFGKGAHKCPGAEVSRLLLTRTLPAMARALPYLTLHREQVRFEVRPMVQFPTHLPVTLTNQSERQSARLIEVRSFEEARQVVNDDKNWGPPELEPHLRALADRSGRNMDTALQIARNAMFFMSGPRHAEIRRAVAQSLGGNRIGLWDDLIAQQVSAALDHLESKADPDLITHFADPIFRNIMKPVLGVHSSDHTQFDALAPVLQDVLEPWLRLRELERLQLKFEEILNLMRPPDEATLSAPSILSQLLSADLPSFTEADLKALILVLYGASFNLSHTIGNVLHHVILLGADARKSAADAAWVDQHLEELIAICGSPKYIYRMARTAQTLGQISVNEGETLRLQLPVLNRGQRAGNLAFGHGLHRCVGAALTKKILRVAIPKFFDRFPAARLEPSGVVTYPMSQTLAYSHLFCTLQPTG